MTGWLIFYFSLAVMATVMAMNVVFYFLERSVMLHDPGATWWWHAWSPQAILGTLLVIAVGCLVEYLHLRGGGSAIAERMGATKVDFGTREPELRRLINVAEEMAIAAGIPVPELYVLQRESGINAFVAGYSPNEAVMVVTAGSLRALGRAELQGVVGHEFSHILNGDMKLNIRLIAILSGLVVLGQMGSFLLNHASYVSTSRNRQSALPHVLLLGLALWLVGGIGLFFGRLIRAAISRQREFLADAASVQFTRHPEGLAGALLKIEQQAEGSYLQSLHAETMSHMGFGATIRLSRLFATHPTIDERLAEIAPGFRVRDRARRRKAGLQKSAGPLRDEGGQAEVAGLMDAIPYVPVSAMALPLTAAIGCVRPDDLAAAAALRGKLPNGVARALETSSGSMTLLYALLAERSGIGHRVVATFFSDRGRPEQLAGVTAIRSELSLMEREVAWPLVEMIMPRLQVLDLSAARALIADLQAFARLDSRLSVFEFAVLLLLRQQLLPGNVVRGHLPLRREQAALAMVVATLLDHGDLPSSAREAAFHECVAAVMSGEPYPQTGARGLPPLAKALKRLQLLSPAAKEQALSACVLAVRYDGRLSREEYDLLRVIAAVLECPLPLLIPGK